MQNEVAHNQALLATSTDIISHPHRAAWKSFIFLDSDFLLII